MFRPGAQAYLAKHSASMRGRTEVEPGAAPTPGRSARTDTDLFRAIAACVAAPETVSGAELHRLMVDRCDRALALLERHWRAVEIIAAELMQFGTVEGARVAEVVAGVPARRVA